MSDIRFDIGSLHAAYAAGVGRRRHRSNCCSPASTTADDPGIFIHLADKAELLAQARSARRVRSRGKAALGHSLRRQGQHRRRRHADHRRLRRLCLYARQGRHRGRAAEGGRRAGRRQDQSRPVRHRPGRRAHALSDPEERHRSGAGAGRLVLRLGGGDGARHRLASRSAPTRPAPAASRPASTTSSG